MTADDNTLNYTHDKLFSKMNYSWNCSLCGRDDQDEYWINWVYLKTDFSSNPKVVVEADMFSRRMKLRLVSREDDRFEWRVAYKKQKILTIVGTLCHLCWESEIFDSVQGKNTKEIKNWLCSVRSMYTSSIEENILEIPHVITNLIVDYLTAANT